MIQIETAFTGTTYALTTPRIGAFPVVGTVTPSTEATGFEGTNANNELTWTYWKPTAVPATWQLSFTSTDVSYCGIASHNIGSSGGTVAVQEWTGGAWANVKSFTPTDDSPIMFLFAKRTTDRMRVRVTNAIPTIGVIWFGLVLEFPSNAEFTGSLPFNEAISSVYTDAVSDGGHVLARYATRKASPCAMTVKNISETWAATNITLLHDHMESLPIFLADRPSTYPTSIVFGSNSEPIRAERSMPILGAARTLSLNIIGNQPI